MNVIVTGASAGIGFEMVKKFISDPSIYKVIGIARRQDRLKELETFATLHGKNGKFVALVSDVMDVSLEDVSAHISRVDVLINNAGLLITAPFSHLTDADFLEVYRTNVMAPARIIRQLMPIMGGTTPTHIVNIGSMGGFQGSSKFAGLSAYSSSKAALANLSECLAEEFKDRGITVNCLAIGAVQTEMLAAAFPGFQAPITAESMATHIADFACNARQYYNGKILPVSSTTP